MISFDNDLCSYNMKLRPKLNESIDFFPFKHFSQIHIVDHLLIFCNELLYTDRIAAHNIKTIEMIKFG